MSSALKGWCVCLRSVVSRLTAEAGLAGTAVLPALLRPLRAMRHMAAMVDGAEASLPALEQALLTVMFDAQSPDERPRHAGGYASRRFDGA